MAAILGMLLIWQRRWDGGRTHFRTLLPRGTHIPFGPFAPNTPLEKRNQIEQRRAQPPLDASFGIPRAHREPDKADQTAASSVAAAASIIARVISSFGTRGLG